MTTIRDFTERDWFAFAGAEGWSEREDGTYADVPLIVDGTFKSGADFVLVIGKTGAELHVEINDKEENTVVFGFGDGDEDVFETKEDAEKHFRSLGEVKGLEQFILKGYHHCEGIEVC